MVLADWSQAVAARPERCGVSERTRDDDLIETGGTGLICMWCGEPIEQGEDYEYGDDGAGAMHKDCKVIAEDED